MEIGPQMFSAEEDRAVSPVIGVILMVAITVILAAVIAAFVLGIGPGDDPVDGAVSVSVTDMDNDTVTEVQLEVTDDGNLDQVNLAGCADQEDVLDDISVGNQETESDGLGDCQDGDDINVIGVGPDGNEETIGSVTV